MKGILEEPSSYTRITAIATFEEKQKSKMKESNFINQPDEYADEANGIRILIHARMTRYLNCMKRCDEASDRVQWIHTSTLSQIEEKLLEEKKRREQIILLKATAQYVPTADEDDDGYIREGTPIKEL